MTNRTEPATPRARHLPTTPKGKALLIVAIVAVLAVSAFAAALIAKDVLHQNVPSTPSLAPSIVAGPCGSTLVTNGPVLLPTTGQPVLVSCNGTGTGQAFNWTGTSAQNATPVFSLTTNATDLYMVFANTTPPADCAGASGATVLTNGTAVTFPADGAYDYCIDATGAFSSFTIVWEQE